MTEFTAQEARGREIALDQFARQLVALQDTAAVLTDYGYQFSIFAPRYGTVDNVFLSQLSVYRNDPTVEIGRRTPSTPSENSHKVYVLSRLGKEANI